MPNFLQRLRARLRNRRFDADLAEELRFHEELKQEELERTGIAPADARSAARRALGNVTLMREESRGVWIGPWIESIGQDARYAVRSLVRQPLHTFTALAVLALAISLISSLFTVVKAFSFEPWPADQPDRIVHIRATAGSKSIGPSIDEYRFVREHAETLQGVAAHFASGGVRLDAPGRVETYPQSRVVSANFLDVIGARIQLGSGFIPSDDHAGGRHVLVVSDYVWRNHFNADPAVVGQAVTLNRKPFTIIGILGPEVDGLEHPVGVWLPLGALKATDLVMAAGIEGAATAACCINMVGRLADGIDRGRARQEVQLLHERFTTAAKRKVGVVEVYGTSYAEGPGRDLEVMPALFSALGLVLILACANVGNLQLARGLARRREVTTRVAIGASRSRIVRQLLVEGLVLALAAGAASLIAAAVLPTVVLGLMGQEIAPTRQWRLIPDGQVAALTAAICILACLLFALAPALHATRQTIPLGSLDRSSTRRSRFHLRSGLLALQVAVCTVLPLGAGLVTRAIAHAMVFDPGFHVAGVLRVSASLPSDAPAAQQRQFAQQLLAELERNEVQRVATGNPIMPRGFFTVNVVLAGEKASDYRTIERRSVSRDFFEVMGIPLIKGRTFPSDAVGEVIVNATFERAYFDGKDALGHAVQEVDERGTIVGTHTIVGVARDAYLAGLERLEPMVFKPAVSGAFVTVGGPAAVERIRTAAAVLNAGASVRAWPLTEDLSKQLEEARMGAAIAWGIGLLGLLLASVGVLGVFAYSVEERRREIGVRLALGAARRQIVAMVVSTSGRALIAGLGLGLLLSLACGPVLRSYLYGLSPLDPTAYGIVMLLLAAAATIATVAPVRRACRIDPAITLRED
jgi:predicted permease